MNTDVKGQALWDPAHAAKRQANKDLGPPNISWIGPSLFLLVPWNTTTKMRRAWSRPAGSPAAARLARWPSPRPNQWPNQCNKSVCASLYMSYHQHIYDDDDDDDDKATDYDDDTGVCEKTLPWRGYYVNTQASRAQKQGLDCSFCCGTAGQGLAQKECLFRRHR